MLAILIFYLIFRRATIGYLVKHMRTMLYYISGTFFVLFIILFVLLFSGIIMIYSCRLKHLHLLLSPFLVMPIDHFTYLHKNRLFMTCKNLREKYVNQMLCKYQTAFNYKVFKSSN